MQGGFCLAEQGPQACCWTELGSAEQQAPLAVLAQQRASLADPVRDLFGAEALPGLTRYHPVEAGPGVKGELRFELGVKGGRGLGRYQQQLGLAQAVEHLQLGLQPLPVGGLGHGDHYPALGRSGQGIKGP